MSIPEPLAREQIRRQLLGAEGEGAAGDDNGTFEFCLRDTSMKEARPLVAATNAVLRQVVTSRTGWNKNSKLISLGRGTILNIGESTLSSTISSVTATYNLSVRQTERGAQSVYAVPYSLEGHMREFTALLGQLRQPAGIEFGICLGEGENQECLLDCGDPFGPARADERRREQEDLKRTIEEAQVDIGRMVDPIFTYHGENWVISGDYSTGWLRMRSIDTHGEKTIRCVLYEWYYIEEVDGRMTETKLPLIQQAELEFKKRTGASTVELELHDGTTGVVDLLSEPMVMKRKGCEFGKLIVMRKGTPFSEQERQFLSAASLCAQNSTMLCRNPDFQPILRLKTKSYDYTVVKSLFESGGMRKPVFGQAAYPNFFTALSSSRDPTKVGSYCGYRHIGSIYSLFSADQARVYTEYKKMLQLQQEDANEQRFRKYLRDTTPKELLGDESVNELYLWMYMDTKHAGNILAGCHVPAVRDIHNFRIPCGACLKLADKLDQAELYMKCPKCGKFLNRLITQDYCMCAVHYDSQDAHVLLLCKVALGAVVVHGYKQLMMHQEVEDGHPMLQICGRVALIRDSFPTPQSEAKAASVKELMEQNGFTVAERTLAPGLDLSEFRYLIFLANMPSAQLEDYARSLPAGVLAGKSFYLVNGMDAQGSPGFEEDMRQMFVGAGAEPLASINFGPKGVRGVPDSVLIEDAFHAGRDRDAYAPSPYAVDRNKCREFLVYDTRAVLPLFAVAYNRYNSAADRDDSEIATLENIIFPYLPPSRP